ncbi:hypothetical protein, partial [Neobacillus sp. LXY-1]|uniref:hypothetical protein n=1 Tax=Neobacillus sp. LXY-1 TaxID=3379133 RepID=UPI003EE10871
RPPGIWDCPFLLASFRTLSFYQEVLFLFKPHFHSLQECCSVTSVRNSITVVPVMHLFIE